jgi:protein-tyrosine phosphatase
MAEYLFKAALQREGLSDSFSAFSAGIRAVDGAPASEFAVRAMGDLNVDMRNHRSRMVTQKLLNSATEIFCLACEHKRFLVENYKKIKNKCFLLKEFLAADNPNVGDPFCGSLGDYERVRDEINSAIDSILKFLTGKT